MTISCWLIRSMQPASRLSLPDKLSEKKRRHEAYCRCCKASIMEALDRCKASHPVEEGFDSLSNPSIQEGFDKLSLD